MKNVFKFSLLFLFLFVVSCSSDDDNSTTNLVNKSTAMVYEPAPLGDPNVSIGSSELTRKENSVDVIFNSTKLIPGHAYTLWILVINEPENCEGSPCLISEVFPGSNTIIAPDLLFIDGLVAGNSGVETFTGSLSENDTSTSINNIVGLPENIGGLLDAETAEIHLVLRSHGPANPVQVIDQTTTFTGGCSTSTGMFQNIPEAEGECGQIQASIHIAN